MRIAIEREQVRAFEILSHDHNPLHNDPIYSRSTQFGCPIVYGMCGVLVALGRWAAGRPFRLTRIAGQFRQPLFEGVAYDLKIQESSIGVQIQYGKGDDVRIDFRFTWEPWRGSENSDVHQKGAVEFEALSDSKEISVENAIPRWQELDYPYSIHKQDLPQLLPDLHLSSSQMPIHQLNALMGSSYLVGMEIPGRQALYSTFEFEFEPNLGGEHSFRFANVSAEWDQRFNRVALSGRGTGIRSFSLSAYQRPNRVSYGFDEILRTVGCSKAMKGKVVFVSGASRGFGNVLAKAFALQSAMVFANYRPDRGEFDLSPSTLPLLNGTVWPIAGDVSQVEECKRIAAEIRNQAGSIDLLVSNAFPRIPAVAFIEQSSSEFLRFLDEGVSATVTLLDELMPLVPEGGTIMLISSRYTREPRAQYSHYVAAKCCLEGLMRVLALEFPKHKFVVVRPPRMLTDQTNLVFDLSPPASAVGLAAELLTAMRSLNSSSSFEEIDLHDAAEVVSNL